MKTNANSEVYGFCPICNARVSIREICVNGNDICENGHMYPSKDSVNKEFNNKKIAQVDT